jgi:hypothetical protein
MTEAAGWVTLGAGNRAVWPTHELGWVAAVQPGVENAELAHILHEANEVLAYPIEIGSLGEALHKAGLRTAVAGASEAWHVTAAMDESGRVDFCTCDAGPDDIREALSETDYIAINGAAAGGDGELASCIDLVANLLAPEDLLIVAALAPRNAPFIGLAPIVVRGPSFSSPALTSPTTRRGGVVANIDLAPTVLAFFRLPAPPSYRNGSPMTAHPRADFQVPQAVWLDAKSRQADAFRPLGLSVLFLLQLVLIAASVQTRWLRRTWPHPRAMLFLMSLPAATYATVALPTRWPPAALLLVVIAVALVLSRLIVLGPPAGALAPTGPVVRIAGLTALLLVIDVTTHARLQPLAPIGYSFGFGGRFYGIGNEAAGLLMAAGILLCGALSAVARPALLSRLLPAGVAVVVTAAIAPPLGADAGNTLAIVIALGAFALGRWGGRRSWLVAPLVGLAALALLIATAHLDASRGPEHMTHIGRAWTRLTEEGWAYFAEFLGRLFAQSRDALLATPASPIAAAWVAFWTYALLRPVGFVRRAYDRLPESRVTLSAIAVGGIAAALLNDSTIAIPTMMLSLALPVVGLACHTGARQSGDSGGCGDSD